MENNTNETKKAIENIGMVLWLECYEKGIYSTKEINEKLSKHYGEPVEMIREEIQKELEKRAQMFALPFQPKDIVE